jgi:allantoicase
VKLGLPGIVHAFVVDTAFFTGNYPSHCWIEGCGLPHGANAADPGVVWHPILERSELAGDTKNTFQLTIPPGGGRAFTHLRLNIFPDGGVARLRAMGEAMPAWTRILSSEREIDLAAAVSGGYVVDTSDRFYGDPRNMLMPFAASNTGDGWETKRRRGPGHDWAVIRLGVEGVIRRIEIDTAHFKGNYPDSASVDSAVLEDERGGVSADSATRAIAEWTPVLPQTKLQPDALHRYERELAHEMSASHVRLNIFPDGGVSRFRVFGTPAAAARRAAVLRQLNAIDAPDLHATLADFCAAPEWVDRVAAARPFTSAEALLSAADAANTAVTADGWREAFRHHPRIGESAAERAQSGTARGFSSREQSAAGAASAAEAAALAQGNRSYEQRFGHVFIVSAQGRSAGEILAALDARLKNDAETELRVAAGEQQKITRLRLERLLK